MFSIIIPVYNAEKYIENTIKSVLKQSYEDFELIVINDGSKDNSKNICEKLANKDERIKFINRKNEGVSKARNYGIDVSKGKYICFLDADDYIENNMLETYKKILDNNKDIDIINCGYFSEIVDEKNKENSQSDKINFEEKYYSTVQELKEDFVELWDKHLLYNIWNKLYSKEILDKYHIRFPEYNWGEDIEFNRDYLLHINNLYNTEKCFYHYIRGRSETITSKYIADLYDVRLKENIEFKEYFEKFGIEKEKYEEFCARRHIERTFGCIENLFNKDCKLKFKQKYKEVKRIILDKTTEEELKKMKPNSLKVRIMLIPYKLKLVVLAMLMGKILSICKNKLPKIFNFLKNRR